MSAQLDQIAAVGTVSPTYSRRGKPSNRITCKDGVTLSVVAGAGSYCSPRPGFGSSRDYEGPYTAVEVGFPSARPEPWLEWCSFADDAEKPTETVYGWVPVEMVAALIQSHGGER